MDMVFRYMGDTIIWENNTGVTVSHGEAIQLGDRLMGVAELDIEDGDSGAVRITGVFKAAAIATDAFAEGELLYWDPAAGNLTNIPGAAGVITAPTSGNTGDADISAVVVTPDADCPEDVFTLVCTDATSAGSEVWSVIGAKSGRFDDLVTAVAYGADGDHAPFAVTVPAATGGETGWKAGDKLFVAVAWDNYPAGVCAKAKASAGATAEVKIG